MITTIQIHEEVKRALDRIRKKESYEEMGDENKRLAKEWKVR